ncbi:hypothetical protein PIB30_036869 [Stylosanthes scabra]|uniref:Uncharacterized protein n=1 Tax=Stylosanthes scabra TaxID=79078 RepID=A0ABU6WFK1_9FABA|nr:hypothetical protein [Stylosanthes scabra]
MLDHNHSLGDRTAPTSSRSNQIQGDPRFPGSRSAIGIAKSSYHGLEKEPTVGARVGGRNITRKGAAVQISDDDDSRRRRRKASSKSGKLMMG